MKKDIFDIHHNYLVEVYRYDDEVCDYIIEDREFFSYEIAVRFFESFIGKPEVDYIEFWRWCGTHWDKFRDFCPT